MQLKKVPSQQPPREEVEAESSSKAEEFPVRHSKLPSESDENDLRSKKKAKVSEERQKQKSPEGIVERVFSKDDDNRILSRFLEHKKKKRADACDDTGTFLNFYDFFKGGLEAEVTHSQLYERVLKIRRKYFKKFERVVKGEDVVFNHPLDRRNFDISESIWGGGFNLDTPELKNRDKIHKKIGGFASGSSRSTSTSRCGSGSGSGRRASEVTNDIDIKKMCPFILQGMKDLVSLSELNFMKANLGVIGRRNLNEFEGKWKKLEMRKKKFI